MKLEYGKGTFRRWKKNNLVKTDEDGNRYIVLENKTYKIVFKGKKVILTLEDNLGK